MDTVKIFFHQKKIQIPRIIDTADISILFSVNIEGLHVRCKSQTGWITVWPSNGSLVFSDDISEGYLIASESQQKSAQNTSSSTSPASSFYPQSDPATPSNSNFLFGRRGDLGSRAVPSMKRSSIPAPLTSLKRKKLSSESPCYKVITLTDIVDDEIVNIYDVPVDLYKLKRSKETFTIDDIQKELAFQVGCPTTTSYIITNKKGLPIRDMPNTRGMIIFFI